MQNHEFRWDDARVFLALIREGTLSGAGVSLGLNASTVGRRLDSLERALGVRLFDRTPDGAPPTALAQRLRPHAEAVERAALGLSMAVEGREVKPEGLVRIAVPPGIAQYLIAPALPRLVARHPGLRVAIEVSTAVADLARREADLALRTIRPTHGDLVMKKLGESEDVLLCSRRYAAEHGPVRRADQVRWITWGEGLAHLPSARWVAASVPEAMVVLSTDNINTQIAAAAAGVGVALLARAYEGVHRLVPMPVAPALRRTLPRTSHDALWLVGHRALREVPRIAATWRFLEEEARRLGMRAGGAVAASS
jgi:DNA-binding transcriptional LysR family regulator